MISAKWFPLVLLMALIVLAVLVLMGLAIGAADTHLSDLVSLLVQPQGHRNEWIITTYRLPRILVAIQVGLHFALAGLIFQAVLRNPLADPSVLGVSGGASLAVVAATLLAGFWVTPEGTMEADPYRLPMPYLPPIAILGGLITGGILLWLSRSSGYDPRRTALMGVALGGVTSAGVMAIVLQLGGGRAEVAMIWLAGSLYARGYEEALVALPWTLIGLLACLLILKPLAVLRNNADVAHGLGLSVARWRPICLVVAIGLSASAVAIVGPVGFVGLIVPHTARVLVGPRLGRQMLACILLAAVLLVASDLIARTLAMPMEVPVGAVTSLLGVPVFVVLLLQWRQRSA